MNERDADAVRELLEMLADTERWSCPTCGSRPIDDGRCQADAESFAAEQPQSGSPE